MSVINVIVHVILTISHVINFLSHVIIVSVKMIVEMTCDKSLRKYSIGDYNSIISFNFLKECLIFGFKYFLNGFFSISTFFYFIFLLDHQLRSAKKTKKNTS